MKEPLVSIIIVNWNGWHLLSDCLASVFAQTFQQLEIILVDNNSTDGSVACIATQFPMVRIVSLPRNTGFTGGNNEGLRHAKGQFIVLLNNDARLENRWLEYMVAAMTADDRLGSCAAKIIIDGTDRLDSAGDIFTTAFTGTKRGELQPAHLFNQTCQVAGPCAAAAIYRRAMLEQIGFFDDDFFLNHEDTDLNLRAWLAGWRCQFVPDAVAYHKVSSSIGTLSDTSVYYFARNSLWVWIKTVPFPLMCRFLPQRVLYELNAFVTFCLIQGKWLPFFKGKGSSILGFPKMIRKRNLTMKHVKLTNNNIKNSLLPITRYLWNRWLLMRRLP